MRLFLFVVVVALLGVLESKALAGALSIGDKNIEWGPTLERLRKGKRLSPASLAYLHDIKKQHDADNSALLRVTKGSEEHARTIKSICKFFLTTYSVTRLRKLIAVFLVELLPAEVPRRFGGRL
jgi:hypothetical protein